MTNLEQTIIEKVHSLPSDEQAKTLEFVENLEKSVSQRSRPICEVIGEISSQIPDEDWAEIPSDASVNHYDAPSKKTYRIMSPHFVNKEDAKDFEKTVEKDL
jgi:hypothetical protein